MARLAQEFFLALYVSGVRQKFNLSSLYYTERAGTPTYFKADTAPGFSSFLFSMLSSPSAFYEEALLHSASELSRLPPDLFLMRVASLPASHQSAFGASSSGAAFVLGGKTVAEILPPPGGLRVISTDFNPVTLAENYVSNMLQMVAAKPASVFAAEPEIAACRAFFLSQGYGLATSATEARYKTIGNTRTFFALQSGEKGEWCGADRDGCFSDRPKSSNRYHSVSNRRWRHSSVRKSTASPSKSKSRRSTSRSPPSSRKSSNYLAGILEKSYGE